jgi:hypothetical protein
MIEGFEIMGHKVRVRYGRVPKDAWAWWRPDEKEIVVSPRIKKMPLSHLHHTLCHEVTHAVLDTIGREDLSRDEAFVDLLSNAVYQVLTTVKPASTFQAPQP